MTGFLPVPPDPYVATATDGVTKLFPAATMDALHADAAAQILDPDSDEYAAIDTATAGLAADSGTALGAALAGTFVPVDGVDRTYTPFPGKTNGTEAIWNSATGYWLHARAGEDTTGDNAVIGIGTDKGAGNGILVSHKNDGSGIRLIHNPSGALGMYGTAYSVNPFLFIDQYVGAGTPIVVKYRTGAAFKDGATISGKTTLASALASFAAGDVGQAVTQIATRALNDPMGSIPTGATITAVLDTTVAAASNGVTLPAASITLASVAGLPTGGGIVAITSTTGVQFVTYTGITGAQLTGCSGGTGDLATGNAARAAVMSAAAGATSTAINFRVSGRAVNTSAGIIEGRNSDDSVFLRISSNNGIQFNPADATAPSLRVKGKNGQTNNMFEVVNFAAGTVVLAASENGISGGMGISINNAGNSARRPLLLTNYTAGGEAVRIKHAVVTPTADMMVFVDNGDAVLTRINKNGYFITKKTSAPADADLNAGEMALWLDATNGAAKLMVKAKEAGGTVRTAAVALA